MLIKWFITKKEKYFSRKKFHQVCELFDYQYINHPPFIHEYHFILFANAKGERKYEFFSTSENFERVPAMHYVEAWVNQKIDHKTIRSKMEFFHKRDI